MSSFSNRRPLERMHSASELVSSGSFASPLAQLSLSGGSSFAASRPRQDQQGNDAPPVPPLNLNLFRTPSVYSVDSTTSLDSLSTISADEHAFNTDPESPSTPRAVQHDQSDYFAQQASAGPSTGPAHAAQGGPLTPKRSFFVASRQASPAVAGAEIKGGNKPYSRSPIKAPAHLHREGPEPHQREEAIRPDDLESVHGEQGSEWGEDEQNFEWLDTDTAEAQNGDGRHHLRSSPSKRITAKMKAAVATAGEGGKKLRKPLVFPRRAAPPPPKDTAPAPPTHSPRVHDGSVLGAGDTAYPASAVRGTRGDARPDITRAWTEGAASASSSTETLGVASRNQRPAPAPLMVPTMVPMRSGDGPSSSSAIMDRAGSERSHLSMQSAAYSFYDLDSPGPSTPRATTPTAPRRTPTEQTFPQGKYHKIPISRLDREREERERSISEPNRMPSDIDSMPPETLVAKGIEARGLGDLPKSAWLFMKAAEGGSATGRMYWGLALRHGWGVAKDDRKAFAELRQACDESLAEGGLDFHQSPGAVKLTLQQKRALTRDLSLGMFEIANCFLEGVGAKKAPDVALSYLRYAGNLGDIAAQEQLGFLLSKGGNGIKKDMKEAAKWYRMAIGQGSSNTFGLAWVWKEKYMY